MHERSLVESLLRQVNDLAREHGAARVSAVRMSIGEFSGVQPELIEMAYEEMAVDTPLAGAELVIERVPLEARCQACGREFVVERFHFECPDCHSTETTAIRGEGLILESVTMEGCDP